MELVTDKLTHLREGYKWALTQADPRVANWLLMQDYYPFCLVGLYLLFVWLAPKFMQSREPFQLKWTLFLYNMGLVIMNYHICSELFTTSWKLGYSYSCQKVNYTDDRDEMRIAKALWWAYFSKVVEFLDTVFFILRKKNNQVSFLHVYHHATIFPIYWISVKWVAGGQSFFWAMINSFVHVIMYSYYGVAALGPEYQKYLWWKKYLTRLQLAQFVAGMAHAAQSRAVGCDYPPWMQWALIIYGATILLLFLNFYFHAYIETTGKSRKKSSRDHVANGHVTSSGKSIANGSKEAKKDK